MGELTRAGCNCSAASACKLAHQLAQMHSGLVGNGLTDEECYQFCPGHPSYSNVTLQCDCKIKVVCWTSGPTRGSTSGAAAAAAAAAATAAAGVSQ